MKLVCPLIGVFMFLFLFLFDIHLLISLFSTCFTCSVSVFLNICFSMHCVSPVRVRATCYAERGQAQKEAELREMMDDDASEHQTHA